VTFSFGDPGAGLYGLARLGLSGADGDRTGSALAVLFAGSQPVAVHARGAVPLDASAGLERLSLPGLEATVDEPLRHWTVRFDDGDGSGFELSFEATGPPAELEASETAAQAGGMESYEQLCRVHGTVRTDGSEREVRCLGQRGHAWGEPDWGRIESTRTLAAWLEDGTGILLTAVRPADAAAHESDATWAAVVGPAGGLRVDEPRLSTTYDEDGRQRSAGLELWIGEDDAYPRRASGEVVCGSTLELGQLRLDCAFLRWHMGGHSGIGRYDLLRRA
jgi:hypothetical protein